MKKTQKHTKKIRYTDEPLEMEVVEDFLPPPDKLILKPETKTRAGLPGSIDAGKKRSDRGI